MKLSEHAWRMSASVRQAIKAHPFNQELMRGTLEQKTFAYYIEQDAIYLQDFARALAIIAAKSPIEYVRCFLRYADCTFIAEQEVVHQFFRKTFNFQETGLMTPATLNYTSYLLRICYEEPVEIAIAAVLPCFWVYWEVGVFIAKYSSQDNQYSRWIETYSSVEFGESVIELIGIFDKISEKMSDEQKDKMLDTFYKSSCLEWHFWNDAYHHVIFNKIKNEEKMEYTFDICFLNY